MLKNLIRFKNRKRVLEKMNIAFLVDAFGNRKESTTITILDLAKELSKDNRVFIISERRKGFRDCESFNGIKIFRVGLKIKRFPFSIYNKIFAYVFAIKNIEKKYKTKFDIIHNFSASPLPALRLLFFKNKKIQTFKSYPRRDSSRIFYKALNKVDIITVATNVFKKRLIRKGIREDKIKIVHSNINMERFKPRDKEELKRKYGFKGKKVILYYGNEYREKGIDILYRAINEVVKKRKDVIFIFALRHKTRKYGNEKFLRVITEDIKIEEYVAMADLVVLPYLSLKSTENNPSCLLEAMACKSVVVTTELEELKEIVRDKKEVMMAKRNDFKDLAEKILFVLENKDLRKRLVENAYRKVKEFDVRKIAKDFLKIYNKLIT